MKKSFLLVILLIMTLLVTGCDSGSDNETKTLTCTRNVTVAEGVRMELVYNATYTGDYVDVVETEEKVISDSEEVLEIYQTSIETMYSPYKDLEHYYYNVTISGDTLTSTTKIDYSKIDTDKMIEIDSANAALIKNGKVKISDLRSMYESSTVGAICK